MRPLAGRVVMVTGAGGGAGRAAVQALHDAGALVLAVGRDAGRLAPLFAGLDDVVPQACDLRDYDAVTALERDVARRFGRLDGLVHLVGGWRGGSSIADQQEADWDFLQQNILTTLRNTGRAFYGLLASSPHGRLVVVSSTAVDRPTAANANYATLKAAAETWVRSTADGFVRDGKNGQHAAAAILVVRSLVDPDAAEGTGSSSEAGTPVSELASAIVNLFGEDPDIINGERFLLTR